MADAPDADQKTEAPTAKRRREATERGETLQSRELSTALVVGAGVVWVLAGASTLVAACRALLRWRERVRWLRRAGRCSAMA